MTSDLKTIKLIITSVVGFGSYGQNIFEYHSQRFNINIEVSPNDPCQGIGG